MSAAKPDPPPIRLYDHRMHDGTRNFADIPPISVSDARYRLRCAGAAITRFLTDHIDEFRIDFEHRGHRFSMHWTSGDWWLFAADPATPDDILRDVVGILSSPPQNPSLLARLRHLLD